MSPVLGLYGLSRKSHLSKGYSLVPFSEAIELLHFSLANGVNFFDTAPGYGNGNASQLLSHLSHTTSDFHVNSKIGLDIDMSRFDLSLIQPHLDHLASFSTFNYSTIFLHSPTQEVLEDFDLILSFKAMIASLLGSHVKFGISLARPGDFILLNKVLPFIDSLQVNMSWLDLRFLPYLSKFDLPIFARSVYGSGLIPYILASKSYEDLLASPPSFPTEDDRSAWDILPFLTRIKPDINRIFDVSRILSSVDSSIVASSLFSVLPVDIVPIIGSLSILEFSQFIESYSCSFSKHSLRQLTYLVSA